MYGSPKTLPAQVGLWILVALCGCALLITHYGMCAVIAKKPFCRRGLLLESLLMILEPIAAKSLGMNAWVSLAAMAAFALLISSAVFEMRGLEMVLLSIKLIAGWTVMEVVVTAIIRPLVALGLPVSNVGIFTLKDFANPWKDLCTFGFGTLGQLAMVGLIKLFRWLRGLTLLHRKGWLYIKIYVRMVALVLLGGWSVFLGGRAWGPRFQLGDFSGENAQYLLYTALAAGLFLVAASYFTQDYRYIDQLRNNETLEKQHALSTSMLQNLRYFRHNMINMLYGLEGVMLSGDTEALRSYYQEMVRRCALVNNENIVSLERVSDRAVAAVLLHAIDRARQKEMPIALYVQQGLASARGLGSAELCQILGVLLDNALEAAQQAKEPYVGVEMRNVDGMVEVIVKNTYGGQVDAALLTQGGQSTKNGHMGQGLSSCYDILKRRRTAFLNFDIGRQYVRAQLLMKR